MRALILRIVELQSQSSSSLSFISIHYFFIWTASSRHILVTTDIISLANGFPQCWIGYELWSIKERALARDARRGGLILVFELIDTHRRWSKESITLHLVDIEDFGAVVSQAEVRVGLNLDWLAASKEMQWANMAIAEDPETDYSALNSKQIDICQPLLSKENLGRINIVVKSDSKEKE